MKEYKFELRRTVWYVEAQIFTPDAADGQEAVSEFSLKNVQVQGRT